MEVRARLIAAVVSASVLVGVPAQAQRSAGTSAITNDELAARLRFLSSDLFEGRQPGTRGEALTTSYLIQELEAFGLQPGVNGEWLQPVSVLVHDPSPNSPNEARVEGRINRPLQHGPEIRLANHAAAGKVEVTGPLVFVGYGIDAPIYHWNDFEGLDLRGKIAIALLGEPNLPDDTTRFNGFRASRYSWARDKIDEMDRRGALGVIWVVGGAGPLSRAPVTGARRIAARASRSGVRFTGNLTDSAMAALLPSSAGGWSGVKAAAGRPGFKPIPLDLTMAVRFETAPRLVETNNVVGEVPGTAPGGRNEHVVLSAHWDAYGIGTPADGDSVYNGALDDGSGVTQLLALARVYASSPEPRTLTFLFTTAEEWGLIGAEAFACDGPLDSQQVIANLNLDDGVELFGPKRDVAPLGIELSSLGATVATVARSKQLRVALDPFPQEGFFLRADNFPFAKLGIPALYMAMGTDAVGRPKGWTDDRVKAYMDRQYHRPSDDYDTVVVDIAGARQLAEFTREVTSIIARAPGRPTWLKSSEFQRPVAGPDRGCR